jgi:effector-binding domain-containing protein
MVTEPTVQDRPAQPYAGVRARVTIAELGKVVPSLWPDVFAWLGRHGIVPAGPPFIRYHVVDMDGVLEVEAGVSVTDAVPSDGHVQAGVLPAGRYAVLIHTGPPQELVGANATLLDWGLAHGLEWQRNGNIWGGRVEFSLTDPRQEPDPTRWRTEVALLLAGDRSG